MCYRPQVLGWAAGLWRSVLAPQERVEAAEMVPSSSDPILSFLPDSVGGFSLPSETSGRGAPCPPCPLVPPEQHDWGWHPARAQCKRPDGGDPAVQDPPAANGYPAAGLCRWAAKASSQNAAGTLKHRVPRRQLQGLRQRDTA